MTSNMGSQIIQANFEDVTEAKQRGSDGKDKGGGDGIAAADDPAGIPEPDGRDHPFPALLKARSGGLSGSSLKSAKTGGKERDQSAIQRIPIDYLAENGFDPQFGARPLKRLIQKEIVNQLSKRILAGDIDLTIPVLVDVFDGVVVFRNETPHLEKSDANRK